MTLTAKLGEIAGLTLSVPTSDTAARKCGACTTKERRIRDLLVVNQKLRNTNAVLKDSKVRARQTEAQAKYRRKLNSQGLCGRCGKQKGPTVATLWCDECMIDSRERNRRRRESLRGPCLKCGTIVSGTRRPLCRSCAMKAYHQIRKTAHAAVMAER